MAQSDAHSTGGQEVEGSVPAIQQHSSVEINHEIFSVAILFLPLIQERQLSVTGLSMCTSTSLSLRGQILPKICLEYFDCLDMTLTVLTRL